MGRRPDDPVTRNGFTIIELLVSMAIVGLLAAMLLPAVQRVRESARNLDCKSRLHQWGLAMHQLEAVHRAFPTSVGDSGTPSDRITVHSKSLYTYWKCPSDHRFDDAGIYTSYLLNDGSELLGKTGNGFTTRPLSSNDLQASEVTDGLSQTVAVAERLLVPPSDVTLPEPALLADPRRYSWHLTGDYASSDAFTNACRQDRTSPYPLFFLVTSGVSGKGYMHVMGPNEIGCVPLDNASSEHPGHVNVLMGDGSVRSVADGIDLTVWRALGTRNGNETVGEF